MASEWVALAGTAIGAGIGGVVTVVSMVVKGRQDAEARQEATSREDRLRVDDRSWTVKLHNLEQRRELYARPLRSAAKVGSAVHLLLLPGPPEDEAKRHIDTFDEVAAEIEVAAVDRSVVTAASEFRELAVDIFAGAWLGFTTDAARREAFDRYRRLTTELLPTLRDACRRDLGFDAPDVSA